MGVFANIDRPANANRGTVFDDGLRDGGDVVFVERTRQRTTTVTAGAEDNLLLWVAHVGVNVGVGGQQLVDVD